ncbi:hypothetical protein ACMD2_09197 [Ananas comosus]|uniref:Uncharacterized protein n=1 Tax=Ananas comosus TaxID=4615 RepID=A0A199W9W5_ANACO|nr:hypothetical protein ACMD2_09197 [Ananas comosus]
MLVAGIDSTSTTLEWVMTELAQSAPPHYEESSRRGYKNCRRQRRGGGERHLAAALHSRCDKGGLPAAPSSSPASPSSRASSTATTSPRRRRCGERFPAAKFQFEAPLYHETERELLLYDHVATYNECKRLRST